MSQLITILFTNDHHGHFLANKQGEGGMSALAALVQSIREEVSCYGGQVLLLSCGDVNTGTPESDLLDAKPDFEAMRYMHYDAMTVGNHEFDNPLDTLYQQQQWAACPFLSANLFLKDSHVRPFDPFIIKDLQGLKIAILGLLAEDTPALSIQFPKQTLEVRPAIETAAELVPHLRQEADIVIALSHLGYYKDGNHGDAAPGDINLAQSVAGIDIIIGGHTHTALFEPVLHNGTVIGQTPGMGQYLGRMDITVEADHLTLQNYELVPINLLNGATPQRRNFILDDPYLKRRLIHYKTQCDDLLSEPVGYCTQTFEGDRHITRHQETHLGRLIIQMMKATTGADVAVISSGLIRKGLPAGTITMRDIQQVFPFHLPYCTLRLSGQELKHYLRQVAAFQPGSGKFPQLCDFYVYHAGDTLIDIMFKTDIGISPIIDDQTYTLALTSFNATGGDCYPDVSLHPTFHNTQITDSQALRAFMLEQSPLDPEDFPVYLPLTTLEACLQGHRSQTSKRTPMTTR